MPVIPPPLFTYPTPTWLQTHTLAGCVFFTPSTQTQAGNHLAALYQGMHLSPDPNVRPTTRIRNHRLRFFADESLLLGVEKKTGILWYPAPLAIKHPLAGPYRKSLSGPGKPLTFSFDAATHTLHPTGSTPLVASWPKTLEVAVDQWTAMTGPIPETPGPYAPYSTTQEALDLLHTLGTAFLHLVQAPLHEPCAFYGWRPKHTWHTPHVTTITKAGITLSPLFAACVSRFPILQSPLTFGQRFSETMPALVIAQPASSAHQRLQAINTLHGLGLGPILEAYL